MTQSNETEEIRNWGMWAHLSSLVWIPFIFIGFTLPVLNIIGPLTIWWFKRSDDSFIDEQAKESLNFQLCFTIYNFIMALILLVPSIIIGLTRIATLGRSATEQDGDLIFGLKLGTLSFSLTILLAIAQLILVINASRKAKNGEFYLYPFTIRFLR